MTLPVGAPPDDRLAEGLAGLRAVGGGRPLQVVERTRNYYASTFASEIVTVQTRSGRPELFCKHGADYVDAIVGALRGVPVEVQNYERVVVPLEAPAPRYLGSFTGSHGTTLVLASRSTASQLHHTEPGSDSAIVRAAKVLGAWHARTSGDAQALAAPSDRIEARRFAEWADRLGPDAMLDQARRAIADLVDRVGAVAALSASPGVVVHGELFTSNVLVCPDGTIEFVDWETCAVGPGELDLAALTVGNWPAATREACEIAYINARFGGSAPLWFSPALRAARLYVLDQLARDRRSRGASVWEEPFFHAQVAAVAAEALT